MRWDLFCRVVDNLGDVGVCWRLARDLASRGDSVRLWIDDASALAWMAPGGAAGVEVGAFDGAVDPGNVVVEAFGCDPPPAFVAAMGSRSPPPVWINLEYLSAEPAVERLHRLPSPQRNGLTKWFFYPGFTPATGGLLREPGLLERRAAFDRARWLAQRAIDVAPGERLVSLFCYDNPALPALLQRLGERPTRLLLTPGHAQRQVLSAPSGVRVHRLPWLSQDDYDRLLWSCDLNFVRGEDSLLRATWAGAPFVWQIYPQRDGVHAHKLQALLDRLPAVDGLHAFWRAWNGLGPALPPLPETGPWRAACGSWRDRLAAHADLVTQLTAFAAEKTAR